MATKTRAQLIAQGQTIKTETTDGANTAARVGLSIEEVAENTYNRNDDDLATVTEVEAAQTDATQALSDASDASDEASAAQTTADTADGKADANATDIAALQTKQTLVVVDGANELTFSDKEQVTDPNNILVGGDPSFTLASSGNINQAFKEIILDQPDSVTFSSDYVLLGDQDIDLVSYPGYAWIIQMFYKEYFNKVYYTIAQPILSSVDVTAPTVTSATVTSADQDALVVVFSEAVTITDTTGLSLTGTSVTIDSIVSGSGTSTLIFALSGNLYFWEAVTFVYGGTNNIIDAASNALTAGSDSVTIQFTDLVSRSEEIANRFATSTSSTIGQGDFSIGVWVKGVNFVSGSHNWFMFGCEGSGTDNFRFGQVSTMDTSYTLDINDSSSNVIRFIWDESGELEDDSWHLFYVIYDYTNKTASLYIDNSLISLSSTNDSEGFDKTDVPAPQIGFRGSNASGGDLYDGAFVYDGILSSGERSSIYNSGTPVDVTTIITPILYLPMESSDVVDVTGNFTMTEILAGGSFSSDTPTNPA